MVLHVLDCPWPPLNTLHVQCYTLLQACDVLPSATYVSP